MSKKETEVTILIPTFNRSGYLQEAIESALAQTYKCDVIVCDHGSTDDTPEVMEKYKDRVKYIRREEDFGPHFCWLEGVLHAQTQYVKILFDDDLIDPLFVEKSLLLMREDVSCVITNAEICYDNKEIRIRKSLPINKTGIFSSTLIKIEFFLFGTVISPSSCLFRKAELIDAIYQGKLLKKGGTYYHGVGPDIFIILLGLLRYSKVGFINEELATFRAHKNSISINANKRKESRTKIKKSYEEVIEFFYFLNTFKIFEVICIIPLRIFKELFNGTIKLSKLFSGKIRGIFKNGYGH